MTWVLEVHGHPEDNSPDAQEAIADRAQALVDELAEGTGVFLATFASNDVSRDLLAQDDDDDEEA